MNPRTVISAAVRKVLGSVTHVVTHESVAALTFDDGPDPEQTPLVLALLEKYKAEGRFFWSGRPRRPIPI